MEFSEECRDILREGEFSALYSRLSPENRKKMDAKIGELLAEQEVQHDRH